MKNYKLSLSLILFSILISCGPKSDAEKVCDCFTELDEKIKSENEELQKRIDMLKEQKTLNSSLEAFNLSTKMVENSFNFDNECSKMNEEFMEKYKNDHDKLMEYLGGFDECSKKSKSKQETTDSSKKQETIIETKVDSSVNNKVESDNEVESEVQNLELYHIEDPDGFSNLRVVPNGKVIRKVYPNENFELLEEVDNHYLVKFNDNSQGYIHKSRVFKS